MSNEYTAKEVAVYIINQHNELGYPITHDKLQKLLYFIQLSFTLNKGRICFTDTIEFIDYNPIVIDVYKKFHSYRDEKIPYINEYIVTMYDNSNVTLNPITFEKNNRDFVLINFIIEEYKYQTVKKLQKIIRNQYPYLGNYQIFNTSMIKQVIPIAQDELLRIAN